MRSPSPKRRLQTVHIPAQVTQHGARVARCTAHRKRLAVHGPPPLLQLSGDRRSVEGDGEVASIEVVSHAGSQRHHALFAQMLAACDAEVDSLTTTVVLRLAKRFRQPGALVCRLLHGLVLEASTPTRLAPCRHQLLPRLRARLDAQTRGRHAAVWRSDCAAAHPSQSAPCSTRTNPRMGRTSYHANADPHRALRKRRCARAGHGQGWRTAMPEAQLHLLRQAASTCSPAAIGPPSRAANDAMGFQDNFRVKPERGRAASLATCLASVRAGPSRKAQTLQTPTSQQTKVAVARYTTAGKTCHPAPLPLATEGEAFHRRRI